MRVSLPQVLKKLGISMKKFPQKNSSLHKHYSYYYDSETKDKVGEMFEFDIEYGQYNFENKNPVVEELKEILKLLTRGVNKITTLTG